MLRLDFSLPFIQQTTWWKLKREKERKKEREKERKREREREENL